jgi:flagellar hook-associated protein 3 FlgL
MTVAYTRITTRSMYNSTLSQLQASQTRISRLQSQMSSGKRITKASDDPSGAASAMQMRGELSRYTQYDRNSSDGLAWLGTIDSTLQSMTTSMNRVRQLVVQGSSTGAMSATDRQALATEVSGLQQSLMGAANTTYLGRPVFGGTTSGSVAYDSTGTYVGDSHVVTRAVGDNQTVRVDLTGPEAFSAGGTDLFSLLGKVQTDLTSNTAGLGADLTSIDAVMNQMRTGLSDVGARYSRIETLTTDAASRSTDLTSTLSQVEDSDLAQTVTELSVAQAAYQATLQSTAKVIQPSLMDYLK